MSNGDLPTDEHVLKRKKSSRVVPTSFIKIPDLSNTTEVDYSKCTRGRPQHSADPLEAAARNTHANCNGNGSITGSSSPTQFNDGTSQTSFIGQNGSTSKFFVKLTKIPSRN